MILPLRLHQNQSQNPKNPKCFMRSMPLDPPFTELPLQTQTLDRIL